MIHKKKGTIFEMLKKKEEKHSNNNRILHPIRVSVFLRLFYLPQLC